MDRAEEFVKELLKSKGYKFTNQRVEIYRVFLENKGKHLSCEDVYEIVSKKDSEIGIATVYRTVQLFDELGVLYSISFDDQTTRYELKDETDKHYHHHVICLSCGKVIEVEYDFLDALEDTIEKKESFKIVDHNLKFYGYCADCQKKGVKNEKQ